MATYEAVSTAIHDFRFYRPHLRIQDRDTHVMVPLDVNTPQQRVRDSILAAEREERPARTIVLKARRMGISTIVQGTFCHRGCTRAGFKARTIADDHDKASNLHGMLETMYEHLPSPIRPDRVATRAGRELRLANGSSFKTETAKDAHAGRSSSSGALHASEFAFWDYPENTLVAMLQTVPDVPGSIVVIESTAFGMGNPFHTEWLRAERGQSGYDPIFFPWMDDPGYDHGDHILLHHLGELDDEEHYLHETLGVRPGQLSWRRHKLKQDLLGNIDLFHQEYPATPEEAFLSTGRPFFDRGHIAKFHPQAPLGRFSIEGHFVRGKKSEKKAVRDDKGPLWIYELPEPDTRYLIFVDPAGVVGEQKAKHFRSGDDPADYTVMWVLNCKTMRTAAVWQDRIDLGLAGMEAAKLGVIYGKSSGKGNAVICPETTGGYGFVITEKLREIGYSPVHRDRLRNQYDRHRVDTYGWATTTATRPLMLETLKDVLRENPEYLRHAPLKGEFQSFIIGGNHIPSAAPGCHDDLVMACAGAYTVAPDYAQRTIAVPAHLGPKRKQGYTDVLSRATKRVR